MTPPLIAIEGVDGAGKTTLARALAEAMNARIIKRPIPGSRAAELIAAHRDDPAKLPDLLSALHDDCAEALKAARAYQAEGHPVILDRHYLSTAVYQGGKNWHDMAVDQINTWGEPDVWIFCSAPISDIMHRLGARGADLDSETKEAEIIERAKRFDSIDVARAIEYHAIGKKIEHSVLVMQWSWISKDFTAPTVHDAAELIAEQIRQLPCG